jgi:hypothetical protein
MKPAVMWTKRPNRANRERPSSKPCEESKEIWSILATFKNRNNSANGRTQRPGASSMFSTVIPRQV